VHVPATHRRLYPHKGVLELDCLQGLTSTDPTGPSERAFSGSQRALHPTDTAHIAKLDNVGDDFKLDIMTPRNMSKQQSQVIIPSDYLAIFPSVLGSLPKPRSSKTTNPYPQGLQHILLALGCFVRFGKQVLDAAKQLGLLRGARS
jgi:hypothetical protein